MLEEATKKEIFMRMLGSKHKTGFSPYRWLIALIGVIVPRRLRADWRQEWEAELRYRETMLEEWDRLDLRAKLDLLRRSIGAFWDALWLQSYRWEDEMIQDLRFGVRMLLKQKGFTLMAVLTLALGIGANTAVFSVVNVVLLDPLPYDRPERLMMIRDTNRELGRDSDGSSPGNYLDLREQTGMFDSVAAWFTTARTIQSDHDAEQLISAQVSVEFFHTLRAQPALGRVFQPGEISGVVNDGAGQYISGERKVVISDRLWRRRFGAAPDVIGKGITINGLEWELMGVMPAGFAMPNLEVDLWVPWNIAQGYNPPRFASGPPREARFLRALARLKPDVTPEQAQSHLDSLSIALAEQYPEANRGWDMKLTPLYEEVVGRSRPALLLLFGAVALVLLLACSNVAGLLMARTMKRQREIAVRSALGASRTRLVRQLLTESMLMAVMGGIAGLALTIAGRDLLIALAPADLPRSAEIAVDGRVLAFTLIVSVLTGLVFGLFPAWKGTPTNLNSALKDGGARGATPGRSHNRFLNAIVVTQVAIALVLLVGAGLMTRSFIQLLATNPGFDTRNLLSMHINLNSTAYRGRAGVYYRQLIERLEALPGVRSAAAVSTLPMSDVGVDFDRPYWREDQPEPDGEAEKVDIRIATPGYFKTMGIPLVEGRYITEQDRRDTPDVLLINESMAAKVWPNENPVGKRLMIDYRGGKYPYEVIGVTRDISYYGLKSRPRPEVFIPHAQNAYLPMNIVIRTTADPAQMIQPVKNELARLDPAQPGHHFLTMDELVSRSISADSFLMRLLGLLSLLALVLAATGIYGVMSYTVAQRTHEIGVRMALGARKRDVLKLAVGRGMALTLIGVALGLGAALALTRLMKGLLFGVSATDPLTFAAIALLLTFVTLPACYLPARRAARVDPMVALRHE